MVRLIESVIFLASAPFLIAFILPPTLTTIIGAAVNSTSTTAAHPQINPAVVSLFSVLVPIIVAMGIILTFFRYAMEFETDQVGDTVLVNRYKYSLSDSKDKIFEDLMKGNQLLLEDDKNGI